MMRDDAKLFIEKELNEAYERAKRAGHSGKTKYIEVLELMTSILDENDKLRSTLSNISMIDEESLLSDMPCMTEEELQVCRDILKKYTPKKKEGRWILTIEDWNKWTCSECGWSKRTDIHVSLGYKYCPECGMKMSKNIVCSDMPKARITTVDEDGLCHSKYIR